MAIFFKGVGVGTHLHATDLRTTGITPVNPGAAHSVDAVMRHVALATITSCYVSLTKSEGVAIDYARNAGRRPPSPADPAYVYEVDTAAVPSLQLLDPLCFIVSQQPGPLASPSYHHDGNQEFLRHVVDPSLSLLSGRWPTAPRLPGMVGGASAVRLTLELKAMARAMRDAEILVVGTLPQMCVTNRYNIV
jgi:hypothetical protein